MAPNVVEALERSSRRPVQEYERAARVLGLDDRSISFRSAPEGNERLAVRLRHLADERPSLSPSSVANLAEAAWVAMTQIRLEGELELTVPLPFAPSSDFGMPGWPAYHVGYELADSVRNELGLGVEPIPSMRDLAESTLGIPVVQTQLDERIAGATVESGERRAIVLNINGRNSDALIRRSTIAHEVCHLLFDPSQELETLRVDEYDEIEARGDTRVDPVEQRANAFAVQLLAPQSEAVDRWGHSSDLFESVLDHFGISFTAGRYQIWNGLGRSIELEQIDTDNRKPESDWDGRESYTLDYHPIRSLVARPSRAGRFGAVAVRAASEGIISWDTASEWLGCSAQEATDSQSAMAGLYPQVFSAVS